MSFFTENPHLAYLDHLPMDVLKALDASSQPITALQRQDLEGDLERLNLLQTPFFDRLGKIKATARYHEWDIITSRHDKIGYAAYKDGYIPRTVEVEVARRRTLPSLIGHRITWTELAEAVTEEGVKNISNVARDEKIIAVMEETENYLFNGDRRFGSQNLESPNNLQFDGMGRIIKGGAPQNITDAAGAQASLALLWSAEQKVFANQSSANPTTVFMSPIDKLNLQASFYQLTRLSGNERMAGVLGANAQTFISAFGESEINPSRFVGDFDKFSAQAFGSSAGEIVRGSPITSVSVALQPVGAVGGDGLALTNGVSVQYAFKVATFGGESAAAISNTVTPTNDTSKAVFTFTGVDPNAAWIKVYRNDNGAGFKFLKNIPYTGGATVLEDDGHELLVSAYGSYRYKKLPGTGTIYGIDMQTTAVAQWLPLEQCPLPQTLNRDWVIRHAMTLFTRAPEFSYCIVNVSQDALL